MKKFFTFLSLNCGVVVGIIFGINSPFFITKASAAPPETAPPETASLEETSPGDFTTKELFIRSVNPGYTIDGVQNVGETIEIGRTSSDSPLSLAGYIIGYTNSSGKDAVLVDLSKYVWKAGETFVLQLASSPGSELADITYSKTLAMKAGPLTIMKNDSTIDSVCWTSKDGCEKAFDSSKHTTLVRNLVTGTFEHQLDYSPSYGASDVLEEKPEEPILSDETEEIVSQCKGLEFSEILSYYESLQSEQFIEFHNSTTESLRLDGCTIKYKNKSYPLSGMVGPDEYFVRYLGDFRLTKNPTNSNVLELVDADGKVLDKLEFFNGQKKGTSFAFIGYDEKGQEIWKVTYAPTPGEPNNYQEFRTCEAGKVINEATGNCVKVSSVTPKVCPEGQFLNLLTGRCKKSDTASSATKECKEGYYYYEATGRCRKIQDNTGADYALVPETYEESSSFVALYLVLGVLALGLTYVIYEFRHEIIKGFKKLKSKI